MNITTKPQHIIKIYKHNKKKVFCELEVPDSSHFDKLLAELNKPDTSQFIKFGPIIFDKFDFDFATYEEITK